MRKHQYELIFIVTPVLSDADLKSTISQYLKYIKDNDGEVVYEDNWGLKQLAYPIKHKTTGYYHLVEFKAPTDLIDKLELVFRRDENILRFLTTRLDKYAVEYNEKRRKGETSNLDKIKEKQEA